MNYAEKQIFELKNLVSRYRRIPEQAHHDFIHFYESYFNLIEQLNFEEMIEMKFTYLKSLYHLEMIDLFQYKSEIFLVDLLNHDEFNKRQHKIYEEILYLKAIAFKDELKSLQSANILAALVKMNPEDIRFTSDLKKNYYQEEIIKMRAWIGLTISIVIISLILSAAQLFIIQHFYPNLFELCDLVRNLSFVLGIILFFSIQAKAIMLVRQKLKKIKEK